MDASTAASTVSNEAMSVLSYMGMGVSLKLASRIMPQAAYAADVETGHIVAADVLDHLPAALGDSAVGLDYFHPDNRVAWVAEVPLEGAADGGGERSTDGGAGGNRGVNGEELPLLGQDFGDEREVRAGLE